MDHRRAPRGRSTSRSAVIWRKAPWFGAALLLLPFAGAARGQGYTLWQTGGTYAGGGFGAALAVVGDTNGDSIPDILVGVPAAGQARLLSGATGTSLLLLAGTGPDQFGKSVAGPGDLNLDGVPDLLVGATQPPFSPFGPLFTGRATAFSGLDGSPLFTVTGTSVGDYFGHSVAGVGDVNGDGVPDFLVGAIEPDLYVFYNPAGPGYVRMCSGASGATLFTAAGISVYDRFGYAAAGLGDVDGDGIPDAAVGAPSSAAPGAWAYVRVVSGSNGSPLLTVPAPVAAAPFGFSVAGAGDADGDSIPDLLAGDLSAARLISGATGSILSTFTGSGVNDLYGFSLGRAGDANGDGVQDFLVGAPQPPVGGYPWGSGFAEVRSGAGGAVLVTLAGSPPGSLFGTAVATPGDVDADGLPDWVVAAPGAYPSPGGVTCLSSVGLSPGSSLLGSGCPGSGGYLPLIASGGGLPLPGNGDFEVSLTRALGGATALLIVGFSSQTWAGTPLPLSLAPFGLPACSLLVSGDIWLSASSAGAGPGNGVAFVPLPVPLDPNVVAVSVFFQWYVSDPGPGLVPASMSAGLEVLIL